MSDYNSEVTIEEAKVLSRRLNGLVSALDDLCKREVRTFTKERPIDRINYLDELERLTTAIFKDESLNTFIDRFKATISEKPKGKVTPYRRRRQKQAKYFLKMMDRHSSLGMSKLYEYRQYANGRLHYMNILLTSAVIEIQGFCVTMLSALLWYTEINEAMGMETYRQFRRERSKFYFWSFICKPIVWISKLFGQRQ